LSGVTFVRDYIQLQFNPPPILNAYTPVTVSVGGRSATLGDEAFANMIIGQINKYVKSVDVQPDVVIAIHFEDTSIVSISLRPSDYRGRRRSICLSATMVCWSNERVPERRGAKPNNG